MDRFNDNDKIINTTSFKDNESVNPFDTKFSNSYNVAKAIAEQWKFIKKSVIIPGPKGEDGVSIVGVSLTQDKGLDLELSNGEHLYTDSVQGPQGENGINAPTIIGVTLTQEMGLDFELSNGQHLYTASVQGPKGEDGVTPDLTNYVTTNTNQSINGTKTFNEINGTVGNFTNINTSLQNIINMFNSYMSFSKWWLYEHTTDHSNDIDKLNKYGIFQYGEDTNKPLVHFPSNFAQWGLLIHTTGGNYYHQILIGNYGTPRIAFRSKVMNDAWGEWYKL